MAETARLDPHIFLAIEKLKGRAFLATSSPTAFWAHSFVQFSQWKIHNCCSHQQLWPSWRWFEGSWGYGRLSSKQTESIVWLFHRVSFDRFKVDARYTTSPPYIQPTKPCAYRKPDPKIYHYACKEIGIQPNEAIFLDDIGMNLRSANKLGMNTIRKLILIINNHDGDTDIYIHNEQRWKWDTQKRQ